ncbi:MAG: phosphohydrolase [Rhodocyclaceae bacterium]|nr:phosphohydrolase [Rhodocyclaceae bacterium]
MRPTSLPYIDTYLGKHFHPAAPRIEDVHVEDIARGLAFQCRFNGQTRTFYSLAQHSLFVATLAPARLKLAALLHDAAKAYLGDLAPPLKALFPRFSQLEDEVMAVIGERFGVADFADPAIRRADRIARATEQRDLMPHADESCAALAGIMPTPARIQPLAPHEAEAAFLEHFRELGGDSMNSTSRRAVPGRAATVHRV